MKKISFIVEKTNTGFSAFAEDLPVYSTGDDMSALKYDILEALDLYFEETESKNVYIGKEVEINCTVVLLAYKDRKELEIIECRLA